MAQNYLFYNASLVDSLRYFQVKRSPYLYDEWQKADIKNRAGLNYKDVLLNFNGYEQRFEVLQRGNYLVIDDNLYDEIRVNVDGENEWFIRGLHYDIATELVNVIYNGKDLKLIRYFKVRIDETIEDVPGRSIETNRFASSRTYAILFNSKLTTLKLGRQKIGKILNEKELVKNITTMENLDVTTEAGAIKLLTLFEKNENQ